MDLIRATNQDFVVGFLLKSRKKLPGPVPLVTMKLKMAYTEQSKSFVLPSTRYVGSLTKLIAFGLLKYFFLLLG